MKNLLRRDDKNNGDGWTLGTLHSFVQTMLDAQSGRFEARITHLDERLMILFAEREARGEARHRRAMEASESVRTTMEMRIECAADAVKIAFEAHKEASSASDRAADIAADKHDIAMTKAIDSVQLLIQTNANSTRDKIEAITQRMNRDDGARSGSTATITIAVSIAAVLITLVVAVVGWSHIAASAAGQPDAPRQYNAPSRGS